MRGIGNITFLKGKRKFIFLALCVVLISFIFVGFSSTALANSYSDNCSSISELKEKYQDDCLPCQIVQVLLAAFMRGASKVYDVSKTAGNQLLVLGIMLWIPFWLIQKISSFGQQEPAKLVSDLLIFSGKVVIAFCFVNAGIGTLVSFAINPILAAGADFGNALLIESGNTSIETTNPIQYTGPTDIISQPVMDKILMLSERISNEVATNLIIGNALSCFALFNGYDLDIGVLEITIPDFGLLLCGITIWCIGFMLTLAVCYYLLDIPFRIGFAIIALPVVIGLWPFKLTGKHLKSVVMIAVNAAGTFLFLALAASFAIRLLGAAYAFNASKVVSDSASQDGIRILYQAIEENNVLYIANLFSLTNVAFFILVFCYIYAFKFLSEITEKYPNKIFGGSMTAGTGSPMHYAATAATMWAANKITAPARQMVKDVVDIAAHQTGKAVTTAAKATMNVGKGAAGIVAGGITKSVGQALGKRAQAWEDQRKESLQNAESNRKNNTLRGADMADQMLDNAYVAHNEALYGTAKMTNKFASWLEKKGSDMMRPGLDTAKRIQEAAVVGGQRVAEAAQDVATAWNKESFMQTTMQDKEQKFTQSVENLTQASRTLATYIPNFMGSGAQKLGAYMENKNSALGKALGSAMHRTGDFIKENKAPDGTIRSKMNFASLNSVYNGQALVAGSEKIQQFKESYRQQKEQNRQELANAKAALKAQTQGFGKNLKNMPNNTWQKLKSATKVTLHSLSKDNFKHDFQHGAHSVGNSISGFAKDSAQILNKTGQDLKHAYDYTAQGDFQTIGHGVGTITVRPIADTLNLAKNLGGNTLDATLNLSLSSIAATIGTAKTLTSPGKTLARTTIYGVYGLGYAFNDALSPVTNTASIVMNGLNVAGKYVKLKAQPLGMIAKMPLSAVGFGAKMVDETLYAGYKATLKPTIVAAKTVAYGAEALARGIQTHTIVGQKATQVLKIGSTSLKTAARSLGLVKNIVKAAAGEDFDGMDKRQTTKPTLTNKYQEKVKEKLAQEQRNKEEQEKLAQEQRDKEEQEKLAQEQRDKEEQEKLAQEQRDKERERKEKEQEEDNRRKKDLLERIGYFDTTFGKADNDYYLISLASKATQIETADYKYKNEVSERFTEIPTKIFEDKVYGYYDLIDKGEIGLHEALRVKQFAQDYLAQNMDPDQYNELIQETNRFILQSRKNLNMGVIFEKDGKEVLISKDHDIVDNYTPSEFAKQQGIENLVGMDIQITDKGQVSRFKLTDDIGGCELTIKPKDSNNIKDTTIYSYHDGNYYKSVGYSHEKIVLKGSSEYDLVKSEIEKAQHEAIGVFGEFERGMHDKAIVASIWGSKGVEEKQRINRKYDQMKKENQERYNQMQKKHQENINRIRNGENVDVFKEYQENMDKILNNKDN